MADINVLRFEHETNKGRTGARSISDVPILGDEGALQGLVKGGGLTFRHSKNDIKLGNFGGGRGGFFVFRRDNLPWRVI